MRKLLITFFVVAFTIGVSAQQNRIALVVGNSQYLDVNAVLRNPENDADLIEQTLKQLGFTVYKFNNASKLGMQKALDNVMPKLKTANVFFFFYAGHGFQIEGKNYLVPTDAVIADKADAKNACIDLDYIFEKTQEYSSATNVFVLDACRNNPFRGWTRGDDERGLVVVTKNPTNSLIAYSTNPGNVALDGSGLNSPYTEALAKYLPSPNRSIYDVLTDVKREVSAKTKRNQEPWFNVSLDEALVLKEENIIIDSFLSGSIELSTEVAGDVYINGVKQDYIEAGTKRTYSKKRIGDYTVRIGNSDNYEIRVEKDRVTPLYIKAKQINNITVNINVRAKEQIAAEILNYVNKKIASWKVKDEFESTDEYNQRIKDEPNLRQKLTVEAEAMFETNFINSINWKAAYIEGKYDADKQIFIIVIQEVGAFEVYVPRTNNVARNFKDTFGNVQFKAQDYKMVDGKWELVSFAIYSPASGYTANWRLAVPFTEFLNGVPMDMVFVKGGSFAMGSNTGDSDEKPVHTVTVSDFYMAKYEITQAQYQAIMGTNPSNFKGDNRPVERVSWNNAQDFINKLNQLTGKTYRLPTEAEWEYAAGGGAINRTVYAGTNSESELGNYAWFSNNSGSETKPVGTKKPNQLGLYDMSGNVWEWCNDWKAEYGTDAQNNPIGPATGTYRVYRGGGWNDNASYCRAAYRNDDGPGDTYNYLGFRVVLAL